MTTTTNTSTRRQGGGSVRWQTVALPNEHGGWGFITEPLILGLLVAATWGGLAIAVVALAAFLLRHPLKLYLKDVRAGRSVRRTQAARKFTLIYGSVMTGAGLLALLWMPSPLVLLPLVVSLPLIGVQLWYDVQNKGRSMTAELAGAVATGAFASSMALFAGWVLLPALGLWLALAIKGVTAVLYVRSRLRLERDKPAAIPRTLAAHGAGVALIAAAVTGGLLPLTALIAMGILTGRAVLGLSQWRKVRPAKAIGMQEVAYGLGFVLLLAQGF